MSLTKQEALSEINKAFVIVKKKVPMIEHIVDELQKIVVLVVQGIRES